MSVQGGVVDDGGLHQGVPANRQKGCEEGDSARHGCRQRYRKTHRTQVSHLPLPPAEG